MQSIREQFLADIAAAASADEVEAIRVRYLGRKGLVTTLRKKTDFRSMSPEDRRAFGQQFNELKTLVENAITAAAERLARAGPTTVRSSG